MKRCLYIFTILIILIWSQGCGKKDTSSQGGGGRKTDLDARVSQLERRVAILEKEAGQDNPGAQYMPATPKEIAETPGAFEGKKIRLMGQMSSLNLASNSLVVSRGQDNTKVDLSSLEEVYKAQLKDININDQTPRRISVMGTFQNGVLKAEKLRVIMRQMWGGPGGPGGPGVPGGPRMPRVPGGPGGPGGTHR
jgi:hypothetical protein